MHHLGLLTKLIAIESYSGNEGLLKKFIEEWFKKRGIKSQSQGSNLLVCVKGTDHGRAFIFNSHMDTVSKGDREWKYGHINPKLISDKLIGLGASDMKSGIASSMLLAGEVYENITPPVDIWFTYVVKEEIDGSGTQSFTGWFKKEGYDKKYKDMACIFTEPTSLKEIEYGHRGNLFLKAESVGDSGHASKPNLIKKHAVREMIKFSDALKQAFESWKNEFGDNIFEPPTVGELTSIQSGITAKKVNGSIQVQVESPNKFPSSCVASFDIRTTPKFHKVAYEKIVNLGEKMGVKVSHQFSPSPAGFTDPREKIVKVAQKVLKKSKLSVSKGSADLGFLTELGVKAIILGPGEKDQAHKTNEFCYLEQIPQAVEIYKKIVENWAK